MNEISDADKGTRNELIRELTNGEEDIDKAILELNEKVDALNEAIARYNNTLKNADDWRNSIVVKMKDHHGDQSEKWQNSEEGEFYADWIDDWELPEFAALDTLERMGPIEPEVVAQLEELPLSP